jgi:hypothetical protein
MSAIPWPHSHTPEMIRRTDVAWAALVWGATDLADDPEFAEPATCECGAPIHEDRGARDHLGNPQCYRCEMDTLAREQR